MTGDLINENTPASELPKDGGGRREMDYDRSDQGSVRSGRSSQVGDDDDYDRGESGVARGSYVTEIREDELPDHAAVKDAMTRFRSMEVASKRLPIPSSQPPNPSSSRTRYDPHLGPAQAFISQGVQWCSGAVVVVVVVVQWWWCSGGRVEK